MTEDRYSELSRYSDIMDKYDTVESVSSLARVDPELAQILPQIQMPDLDFNDVPALRQLQKALEASITIEAYYDVQETTLLIPMRDGHKNEAIIFQHTAASELPSPLVVLVFGGGFIAGNNRQLSHVARPLVRLYGATVVSISYRLAPENRFPIPANDVWDNIEWLSQNAASINANPSAGFVVGGSSAGANLAAVAVQKAAKSELKPQITGHWSNEPVLLEKEIVPEKYAHFYLARTQNAYSPGLDARAMKALTEHYRFDAKSPDFSPFNDPNTFSKLPRTYIQVCGLDPVRDDGIIYAKTLVDHQMECKLDVYPGVPHGFCGSFPMLQQARKCRFDALANIGWLLRATAKKEDIETLL